MVFQLRSHFPVACVFFVTRDLPFILLEGANWFLSTILLFIYKRTGLIY